MRKSCTSQNAANKHECPLAKIGVDTDENGPGKGLKAGILETASIAIGTETSICFGSRALTNRHRSVAVQSKMESVFYLPLMKTTLLMRILHIRQYMIQSQ